jgi:hypothetical protein
VSERIDIKTLPVLKQDGSGLHRLRLPRCGHPPNDGGRGAAVGHTRRQGWCLSCPDAHQA